MSPRASVDYEAVFAASRHAYLLLSPEFRILDANRAYLRATMTERGALIGRYMFDAFPDNPDDPGATGTHNLGASLQRVLGDRLPDAMPMQRYDIRRPDGVFEERVWDPVNTPVVADGDRVRLIIHHVLDVTDRMHCGMPNLALRRQAPIRLSELRGVLAADDAGVDKSTQSIKSSESALYRARMVVDLTQTLIDDTNALIAGSLARLARKSR